MTDDPLLAQPNRPIWLVTLADLALLLVGFFVLMHATQGLDRAALAKGLREGFGASELPAAPIPVAASAMTEFATGSAALPAAPADLIAWVRDATRDPRVTIMLTGSAQGGVDVDPLTGSAAILAADRARALAAALVMARVVRGERIAIATTSTPARRAVMVTQSFTGPDQ